MITVTLLWTLLYSCTTGNNTTVTPRVNDTVVLYKKDTAIITGIAPLPVAIYLPEETKKVLTGNSKLLLVLHSPRVAIAPDGVFEVYLTDSTDNRNILSSEQQSFVSLLDLYSFTAPGAKQEVEIDITQQVRKIMSTTELASPLFVILRFAPARLADGSFSVNAGRVTFSGISVLKING